jgi:hypothetical protein
MRKMSKLERILIQVESWPLPRQEKYDALVQEMMNKYAYSHEFALVAAFNTMQSSDYWEKLK